MAGGIDAFGTQCDGPLAQHPDPGSDAGFCPGYVLHPICGAPSPPMIIASGWSSPVVVSSPASVVVALSLLPQPDVIAIATNAATMSAAITELVFATVILPSLPKFGSP
jgi:hypothetical protein